MTTPETLHPNNPQYKYVLEHLNEVGDRIKDIRQQHGETQERFAKQTGVSRSFLALVEKGQKKPSFELLLALRTNFVVNIGWILTGVGAAYAWDDVRLDELKGKVEVDEIVRFYASFGRTLEEQKILRHFGIDGVIRDIISIFRDSDSKTIEALKLILENLKKNLPEKNEEIQL